MHAAANVWLSHARVALLSLAMCVAGCHSAPYVWVQNLPPMREPPPRGTAILPGDTLHVSVFGQPSLETSQPVAADGTITVALLGPVAVVGMQASKVSEMLAERWKPFVNSPSVTVVMRESLALVTVIGQMKSVGVIEVPQRSNVLQVIAKAGGLGPYARHSKLYILRNQDGRLIRVRFDYDRLVEGDPASLAFKVSNGDTLVAD